MITIKTPLQYINEPDIIGKAGSYIKKYGQKALIIGSHTALKVVGTSFYQSLRGHSVVYDIIQFSGYPTEAAITRYSEEARQKQVDAIVAVGGGKVHDVSKVVGTRTNLPVISVPTIAATCASWAACSILYNEEGSFESVFLNAEAPRLIIADTRIIATAPPRYLKAGILDTLAKWYETVPNLESAQGDFVLVTSVHTAKLALDIIDRYGLQAVEEGGRNIVGEAAIQTVHAIIALAGLVGSLSSETFHGGFAHPFYNASTRLPNTRHRLHGEKVALGLLIQLVLENRPDTDIIETINLFQKYDLALTLEEIGIKKHQEEDIRFLSSSLATEFLLPGKNAFARTTEDYIAAFEKTDALIWAVRYQDVGEETL